MEQDQEKKLHVCKLCNKSFFNGRILGGHMRIHGVKNSSNEDVNPENSNISNHDASYGLRENRKKSLKSSTILTDNDVVSVHQQSVKCRICGKQFVSARSLHGHMRHHSVEERNGTRCGECGKGFKTVRSLTGHMRLHSLKNRVSKESRASSGPNLVVMALCATQSGNLVRKKRSSRTRYKVTTPNSSFSSLNESVSGCEVEDEVEEVAMCLMMLSRDVREWVGFKSVDESFDIAESGDGDELVKEKKPRIDKFDSCASDCKNKTSECGDFDCDMVLEKKVQLELPIVSFYKATDSKQPDERGLQLCDKGIEHGIYEERDSSQENKEAGLDLGDAAVSDACRAELGKNSGTEMVCSSSDFDACKKNQFQCRICNKMFPTHQALGGHQTLHRTKNSDALKIEHRQDEIQTNFLPEIIDSNCELAKLEISIKQSVEEDECGFTVTSNPLNKTKKHKCPICSKFFVSGQALGGHKRAHLAKAREEEQNMAIQQDVPDISDELDINLPAIIETEPKTESGFNSFWIATIYKHEPILDGIAT